MVEMVETKRSKSSKWKWTCPTDTTIPISEWKFVVHNCGLLRMPTVSTRPAWSPITSRGLDFKTSSCYVRLRPAFTKLGGPIMPPNPPRPRILHKNAIACVHWCQGMDVYAVFNYIAQNDQHGISLTVICYTVNHRWVLLTTASCINIMCYPVPGSVT